MAEIQAQNAPQNEAHQILITSTSSTDGQEKTEKSDTGEVVTSGAIGQPEPPYTILSEKQKVFTIILASFAAFISPVSSSIYYPALNSLSRDLHVSVSKINLSITVYMIFQGIAPSFIGTISDKNGRRPAYLICFILYLGANIGLALQNSYASLMVLRCLQSSGSSGTAILGMAAVADIITRAERGKYMAYASMGVTLGPAFGPLIGGLLDQFLGWRSIFWFLTIFTGVMLILMILFFPETSRSVVGNGSIPPQKWNLSVLAMIQQHRRRNTAIQVEDKTLATRKRRPNPFESLTIIFRKEESMILLTLGLLFAGFFAILSSLASQLQKKYDYNSLQVGLCYIPYGLGSMSSRWTVGTLIDWNFRRHAKRLGVEIVKNRQQKLADFPIELVRLQIVLPLLYSACVVIVVYSWVMEFRTNIAGPVVTLFVVGHTVTGAFSSLNTLIVDINVETPATAVAASNLVRCLLGAGAVAAVIPVIDKIGFGWTGTLVACIWLLCSPLLWAVMRWGHGWRKEKAARLKKEEEEEKKIGEESNIK